jgi:hypothetical protein
MTRTRTLQVRGSRAPDDVWDRYVRPARWPEWSPQIRSVRYAHERLRPGTSGTVVGPVGLTVPFDVLDVDETDPGARSWTWAARLGAWRVRMRHEVRPLPDGGTVTRWRVEGPAPVLAAYAPLAWVALRRLVR